MVDKICLLMEDQYRKHGASSNAAQISIRDHCLRLMRSRYSDVEIEDMLLNDFDNYHEKVLELLDWVKIRDKGWIPYD